MRLLHRLGFIVLSLLLLPGMTTIQNTVDVGTWLQMVYPLESGVYKDNPKQAGALLQRQADHYDLDIPSPYKTHVSLHLYTIPDSDLLVGQIDAPPRQDISSVHNLLFLSVGADQASFTLYDLPPEAYKALPATLKKLLPRSATNPSEYTLTDSPREAAYFIHTIVQPGYLLPAGTMHKAP